MNDLSPVGSQAFIWTNVGLFSFAIWIKIEQFSKWKRKCLLQNFSHNVLVVSYIIESSYFWCELFNQENYSFFTYFFFFFSIVHCYHMFKISSLKQLIMKKNLFRMWWSPFKITPQCMGLFSPSYVMIRSWPKEAISIGYTICILLLLYASAVKPLHFMNTRRNLS